MLLRELLQNVDFGLDDKFCGIKEIKNSWYNTHMSDGLLTFSPSLFNFHKRSNGLHSICCRG